MTTQAELKYYTSLLQKKYRIAEKKFLVEGNKLILEALNSGYKCDALFISTAFSEVNGEFIAEANSAGITPEIIKNKEIEKLTDTKTPQGSVAVFNNKINPLSNYTNSKLIAALENISDPGNLGTILRNCDWFGVANIIVSPNCAESFNPKVIRSSAGSVFHLNIIEEENFYREIKNLQSSGFSILCADLDGMNIYKRTNFEKAVLIMANEADGPSAEIKQIADFSLTIPKKGNAESLNVASASAVLLSELTR